MVVKTHTQIKKTLKPFWCKFKKFQFRIMLFHNSFMRQSPSKVGLKQHNGNGHIFVAKPFQSLLLHHNIIQIKESCHWTNIPFSDMFPTNQYMIQWFILMASLLKLIFFHSLWSQSIPESSFQVILQVIWKTYWDKACRNFSDNKEISFSNMTEGEKDDVNKNLMSFNDTHMIDIPPDLTSIEK